MTATAPGEGAEEPRRIVADDVAPAGRAAVLDEVEMAARVGRRVAKSLAQSHEVPKGGGTRRVDQYNELVALRDQISEARAEDVAALVAQMIQTAGAAAVDLPKATGSIDPNAPYFGHLRLEEGGRARDVLVGKRGLVDRQAGVVIVDWRNAPVSRLYYRYEEGDDYEEEFGQHVKEGTLQVRRTVSFADGRLVRVKCPAGTFLRKHSGTNEGLWTAAAPVAVPELKGGVGTAERAPPIQHGRGPRGKLGFHGDSSLRADKHLPEIAALIDPAQFDAMTQRDSGVIVLQGGAGSGKTTIALHRVSWLAYEDKAAFRPEHMIVVVSQPPLAAYVERLLPALDVGAVKVFAHQAWARSIVERIVGRQGRRFIDDAPTEVSRLKKHPALLAAMMEQAARREAEADAGIIAAVDGRDDAAALVAAWRARAGLPIVPRLAGFLDDVADLRAAKKVKDDTGERARRAADLVLRQASDLVGEWEELITDRDLLARTTQLQPKLEQPVFEAALRWTKRQVEEVEDLSDVDDDAKTPIDDAGPDEDDPTHAFDPHDASLLLGMWIARTGGLSPRSGRAVEYDHVVVDEAQDFSAVELWPLLTATGKRSSMTLAGDVVQKVVFDNGFADWDELTAQLGIRARAVEPLKLSYRSTAEVVEFARQVLGPLAPPQAPRAVRSGAPVEVFSFDDPGEEIAFLAENLRAVMGREPQANVALLCRYPERARFYAEMLDAAEVPRLRLVLGDEKEGSTFTFTPGIDVTTIGLVKGLEYDYVVLAEVTEQMYPDAPAPRHLLHIGATRAAHQLWVTTSTADPSPLLPQRTEQP